MYCQSCGAPNSNEAKFCNQCGSKLAAPGEPAGPVAVKPSTSGGTRKGATSGAVVPDASVSGAAPDAANVWAMHDPKRGTSSVSRSMQDVATTLSQSMNVVGVRSPAKTWLLIAGIALALVAMGATLMWVTSSNDAPPVQTGHAEPTDPFLIGVPVPEEPSVIPSGVEEVVPSRGTSRPSRNSSMTSAMSASNSEPTMSASNSETTMSASNSETTMSASNSETTMSASNGSESTMSASNSETTMSASNGNSETNNATSMNDTGSSGGTLPTNDEGAEERDIEMTMYSSQVRALVRRFYAARAQTCFDRATRNQPTLSGVVVINLDIGDDGNVQSTEVDRNTTGDDALATCLRTQVGTWQLPPPPGGGLTMQMPFSR